MTQTQSAVGYKRNSKSFPILFEDGFLRVYKNPSDEIFVEDIESGVTMRISQSLLHGGGLMFSTEGAVEPIVANGTIHWRVCPRS